MIILISLLYADLYSKEALQWQGPKTGFADVAGIFRLTNKTFKYKA